MCAQPLVQRISAADSGCTAWCPELGQRLWVQSGEGAHGSGCREAWLQRGLVAERHGCREPGPECREAWVQRACSKGHRGLGAESLGLRAEMSGCRALGPGCREAWVQNLCAQSMVAQRPACRAWVHRLWAHTLGVHRAWVSSSECRDSGDAQTQCTAWCPDFGQRLWVQSG